MAVIVTGRFFDWFVGGGVARDCTAVLATCVSPLSLEEPGMDIL